MTRVREPWFPSRGDEVVICGHHAHAGRRGVITNSPGKVFTGWTVQLDPEDDDIYVGVATRDLRRAEDADSQSVPRP